MHSRIFQVSTNPIKKENYTDESEYYDHWFTRSVADYVSSYCFRNEDLKWFEDCYENQGIKFGVDDNGEYLVIQNKQKYFENSFHRFMEAVDKIKNYTINDFANGFNEMDCLKDAYEDKYGFYMEADGYGLITIDSFVRQCSENIKYYIGAIIDYHY